MTEKELASLFEELELRLIASLKRNLSAHKAWEQDLGFDWTAWQAEKIKALERFRKENEAILREYRDTISKETRKLLEEQFAEGQAREADELGEATDDSFFELFDEKLESLIDEMHGKETTVEKAALRMMDDIYRQTIQRADMALQTGSVTVPKAIEMAVEDFARQGINCVEYRDGRRVNIADYVQMALRTSNTRAALLGGAKQRMALGIDIVRVSSYGGCSETCQPWQGGIYIDDVFAVFEGEIVGDRGKSRNGKWYLLLSVAVKAGLFHPNCRHTLTGCRDDAKPAPPLDGERIRQNYKLEQKQRALERNIRKWKRLEAAASDPVVQNAYGKKVRAAQAELRAFIAEHKDVLRRDNWREKTYGTPNVSRQKNPNTEQFTRYKERLGDRAPQTLEAFEKIKYGDETAWQNLQMEYRCAGITDRLLSKMPNLRIFKKASDIPPEYSEAVKLLSDAQRNGLYHYSHFAEGIRMNMFLGGVPDVTLSPEEMQNLLNVESALKACSLPYDTVLWRGTESRLLDGFDALPKNLKAWKGKKLSYKGFGSTSVLRDTSYMQKPNKDTLLVLVKRANQTGVAYIDDISYNRLNNLSLEYEALLQRSAEYGIIEAQIFKGKYIIVAEVL